MNALQIFDNPEFGKLRTLMIDGEPWAVGKDVAAALGYKDTVNALKAHIDDEDKRGWRITTPSGEQAATVINESGLYSLIFASKLESAKRFKRWVTGEVLPALRKTGRYTVPGTEPDASPRPTVEQITRAAEIVSHCAPDRLYIVSSLLRQGGFQIPAPPQPPKPDPPAPQAQPLPMKAAPPWTAEVKARMQRLNVSHVMLANRAGLSVEYLLRVLNAKDPETIRGWTKVQAGLCVALDDFEAQTRAFIARPNGRSGISEEDRDRMQYEALKCHPQLIFDCPEAILKHPDLADLVPNRPPDKGFDCDRFRAEMDRAEMGAAQLSRASGVCESSINAYRRGTRVPHAVNRLKLCAALDVPFTVFDK